MFTKTYSMKNKILFVYDKYVTFIRRDFEILTEEDYEVKRLSFNAQKNVFKLAWSFLKQFVSLWFLVSKYDIIFIWFADYHAFFPVLIGKLFKKKIVLNIAGFDASKINNINYGLFAGKKYRVYMGSYAIRNADLIFGVDDSMILGENNYIGNYPSGVKFFVPDLKGRCEVVPFGFDQTIWKRNNLIDKKENSVVSVGTASDITTLKRKGFDFLLEIAAEMPNVDFTIIGVRDEALRFLTNRCPKNLTLIGFLNFEELINNYSAHKVFAQISLNEGQPNTLCEAMFCECIPVGSSVNGIPNVIDNENLIIKKKEIKQAKEVISYALSLTEEDGKIIRESMIKRYPKSLRKEKIQKHLSKLTR